MCQKQIMRRAYGCTCVSGHDEMFFLNDIVMDIRGNGDEDMLIHTTYTLAL
jgi:hypothetical protein